MVPLVRFEPKHITSSSSRTCQVDQLEEFRLGGGLRASTGNGDIFSVFEKLQSSRQTAVARGSKPPCQLQNVRCQCNFQMGPEPCSAPGLNKVVELDASERGTSLNVLVPKKDQGVLDFQGRCFKVQSCPNCQKRRSPKQNHRGRGLSRNFRLTKPVHPRGTENNTPICRFCSHH